MSGTPPAPTPTVALAAGALFVPPPPVTRRWKEYFAAFFPVLGGRSTPSVTVPVEHGTDFGRPETAGLAENSQLEALATVAESVTQPLCVATEDGVAVNAVTEGLGTLAAATAAITSSSRQAIPDADKAADDRCPCRPSTDCLPPIAKLPIVDIRSRRSYPTADGPELRPASEVPVPRQARHARLWLPGARLCVEPADLEQPLRWDLLLQAIQERRTPV